MQSLDRDIEATSSARRRERLLVLVIVLISGALGTAHALITPTWANVEEAGHYEHIRLRAELGRRPTAADRSDSLLGEIDRSRVWMHHAIGEAGMMRNAYLAPELADPDRWDDLRAELVTRPGYNDAGSRNSQLQEPPAYYWLAASVFRIVRNQEIDLQILALRIVSVVIGMAAVWLSYLAARELVPDDGAGRLVLPAMVGVHSSFGLIASSVGNTVMAVLAVSFALYVSLRVIRHGYSWLNASLLLVGIGLCLISKPTALPGVGVIVVSPLLALPPIWRRRVWLGLAAAMVLGLLLMFRWQRPAAWYPIPLTQHTAGGAVPQGRYAIVIGEDGDRRQALTADQVREIAGERITVGYWTDQSVIDDGVQVWGAADQEGETAISPQQAGVQASEGGWTFQTQSYDMPDDAQCAILRLGMNGPAAYDGIVLVPGDFADAAAPEWDKRARKQIEWDGQSLSNFIRNGSGERGWPLLRPEIEELLPERVADSGLQVNERLAGFLDWRGNAQIIGQSTRWLFSSFWSRFSWTVPGYPRGVIVVLGVLYVIALFGLGRQFMRPGGIRSWQGQVIFLMGIALVLFWGLALLRIDPPNISNICDRYQGRFISTGYYIVPGILPMMSVLYLGLGEWSGRRGKRIIGGLLVLGLFSLTVISLIGRQIPAYLHFYGIDLTPGLWSIVW